MADLCAAGETLREGHGPTWANFVAFKPNAGESRTLRQDVTYVLGADGSHTVAGKSEMCQRGHGGKHTTQRRQTLFPETVSLEVEVLQSVAVSQVFGNTIHAVRAQLAVVESEVDETRE